MDGMTVQALRDYVRETLDVDEEELSDTLLDIWTAEGTSHIQTMFESWSFYDSTWDAATSTGAITLTDLLDANDTSPDQVTDVFLVVDGAQWKLDYIPYRDGVAKYASLGTTASTFPESFSIYAGQIWVWPLSDSSNSYTVIGVRTPLDAVEADDIPDLPSAFHPLIAEWMLARAYERDDDEIMSTQKFNRVDQQLNSMKRRFTRAPRAGVMAIGQNHEYDSLGVAQRLRYDFE